MRKTAVVAIVGGKKSGKTTTIEALVRNLSRKGYEVAVVKHISEPDFTIDTAGKDTWRYAQSGAKTIVSVARNETTTMEKADTINYSLNDIVRRCGKADIIFLEGFKDLVAKDCSVCKVVPLKSAEEAHDALKTYEPIIAFTGSYRTENLKGHIPYIDVKKNSEKIAALIEGLMK